jgi:RNA polymerase sigma-70 factor (ECF subfamily)
VVCLLVRWALVVISLVTAVVDETPDPEAPIRASCERQAWSEAATAAIRLYGREVCGFLIALHRDPEAADEVFAIWSEHLWRGLPGFAWRSSFRTWLYTLARHASIDFRRGEQRRQRRNSPLSSLGELSAIAQQVRTETRSYLGTERKDRFAELRRSLPEEDQELLILRVDRGLPWEDLARITLDQESPSPADLKRESQRLRKRFQLLKERLLEMGKKAGLVPDE